MNALANDRVAEFVNDNFTASYLKVGTFKIVGGAKQGGNVATYFCTPDGSVLHAVAGQVDAATLLAEARWAEEIRKAGLAAATNLTTGKRDMYKFKMLVKKAHTDRFHEENGTAPSHTHDSYGRRVTSMMLPGSMPHHGSNASKIHWLLGTHTLRPLETFYPFVWRRVLNEELSTLPVAVK